jgi:hypothetical protein
MANVERKVERLRLSSQSNQSINKACLAFRVRNLCVCNFLDDTGKTSYDTHNQINRTRDHYSRNRRGALALRCLGPLQAPFFTSTLRYNKIHQHKRQSSMLRDNKRHQRQRQSSMLPKQLSTGFCPPTIRANQNLQWFSLCSMLSGNPKECEGCF